LFASAAAGYHESMRIACPACAAAYDVPDARLTPGGVVRCARCGTDWAPLAAATVPEPPAIEVLPPESPSLAAPDGIKAPASSEPSPRIDEPVLPRFGAGSARAALALAWLASVAALCALAWAAVTWRADIMQAWPNSARLYALLGLIPGR